MLYRSHWQRRLKEQFRESELGIFLRDQAFRFESLAFEDVIDFVDKIKQYVAEEVTTLHATANTFKGDRHASR